MRTAAQRVLTLNLVCFFVNFLAERWLKLPLLRKSHALQGSHVPWLYSHFSVGVVCVCSYCMRALFSWGVEKWFIGFHLIQIGVLPQSKGNKKTHLFLNFLTQISLSRLSVSMSVPVRLPRWQLVIHFSSATRSVPCVLIRANSLVGLTQVSLKHWSDLLPGCTLTSACSGNYYCSPHFMRKHTVTPPPPPSSRSYPRTWTHTFLAESIHTPLCRGICSTRHSSQSRKC